MTSAVRLQGIGVSDGIAVAPVFALTETVDRQRTAGTVEQERLDLAEAVNAAGDALAGLMQHLDEEAAEILEFQVMLLDDEDLMGPILAAVDQGLPADRAWQEALDREIAEYAAGDDEVFAARASDLTDLRDRVLLLLRGGGAAMALPHEPSILVARDLAPSRFLEIDSRLIAGIALGEGSRTSHVSLLARAKGLPLVVGLGEVPAVALQGTAILDAGHGSLMVGPTADMLDAATARAEAMAALDARARELAPRPAATGDGDAVSVMVNIDHPSILAGLDVSHCDGIGLTRTEFLFEHGAPSEDSQLESYLSLVRWAAGRPVTIRTLDAGGDKPIPGITRDGETNPFLGLRGLRLSLRRPEIFKVQLRALLRAAAEGPIKVMVPMVTEPDELVAVCLLIDEAAAELAAEGRAFARPALGMMVEVPAAVLAAEAFAADFYSIGTNDLVQYATACARDNVAVAPLARGDHPGVVRLIEAVVAAGRARGVEVSVCGDMASDRADVALLLAAGVRVLSVAPAEIGRVKAAVADHGAGPG